MKFYGNLQMNQNELRQALLEVEGNWPTTPEVGQILFLNKVVYICVSIDAGVPAWIPLTREASMFVYSTDTALTQWNIHHDLNTTFVIVQIFDTDNQVIIPDGIQIIDASNVKVTFTSNVAGRAVILTGSIEGITKPAYAVEYVQSNASTSWVINHNLGYSPIAKIYVDGQEIQPLAIVYNSSNQLTITFSSPQVGVAKLI